MEKFINEIVQQEILNLEHLIHPFDKWSVSPTFVNEFSTLVTNLLDRYFHRASLFGNHRTDNKKKQKIVLQIKESDFSLAWQTLEQDASN